jgi:quinol monooxygenase YgiN
MDLNNVIRVVAAVKIDPSDRMRFESMVKELRKLVEGEGLAKVLTYDCYCKNENSSEYLITEDYADEVSFLEHLRLIAPVSARHNVLMEVLQFYLCGSLSPDTVEMFKSAYKEKFANYGSKL